MPPSTAFLASELQPVVSRLVETVLSAELGRDDVADLPHLDEAAALMLHKLLDMPEHLSLGMRVFTLTFDALPLSTQGRRFRDLPAADRRVWLQRMRRSPIGLFRNFADFYEKMGAFVFYSLIEESGGSLPPAAR